MTKVIWTKPRKTFVTRWLRGQQPRGTTPALIAEVFTRRLGRRLTAQDLGLDACAPVYAGLEFAAGPEEIFLHDTPAREVFQLPRRDLSSGCIRVANGCRVVDGFLTHVGLPWKPLALFQIAERDALFVAIIFQDLDCDFVADIEHFRRMIHTAPGEIRDMKQPINAAEIDEHTIVGNILHDAPNFSIFFQYFQRESFFARLLVLQDDLA